MSHRILEPRRVFMKKTGVVGFAFTIPSFLLSCDSGDDNDSPEPIQELEDEAAMLEATGQGVYTRSNPLDQAERIEAHVPTVIVAANQVTLSTTHPQTNEHWISHHYIRNTDGIIVRFRRYGRPAAGATASSVSATFDLSLGMNEFVAYQYCNLHWTWTNA